MNCKDCGSDNIHVMAWVDKNNKTLDIGGTIVPVYVINSIFNNILFILLIWFARRLNKRSFCKITNP